MSKPQVSVVIGSYNRLKYLRSTIETLRKEVDDLNHEIIIVDGGSTDGSIKWLAKQKDIVTVVQHNRGKWRGKMLARHSWGYFMNLGFKSAQGKYICMLSDDCLVIPGAIKNGYQLFEEKLQQGDKIGALAFYYRDWPYKSGSYMVNTTLFNKMYVNHGIYLKSALEEINYIDEDNFNFYYADCDLCLRLWKNGYQVVDSPNSFIEHFGYAGLRVRKANENKGEKDRDSFIRKWSVDDVSFGRLTKDYIDKFETYKKFGKFNIFKIKMLLGLNEYFKKIIKKEKLISIKEKLFKL